MPLNNASLNVMADAWTAAAQYASIHTAQPDAGGSNESSADRELIDWGTASGSGDVDINTPIQFSGGASSGAATHVGFWSDATGGTFYGYAATAGDQAFNAAGEIEVDSVDFDLSVS